jgi:hypothetical protein
MAKKWKDPRTGRIFEGDENGWEITTNKTGDPNESVPARMEEHGMRATTLDDYIRRVGQYVPEAITAGGSMIGGIPGGMAGNIIGKGLQMMNPEWFGEYNKTFPQFEKDFATDTAIDMGFTGAGKVLGKLIPKETRKQMMQKLVQKYFPANELDAETKLAIDNDPNFKYTVGQGNKWANLIEQKFAPSARQAFEDVQNQDLITASKRFIADPAKVVNAAKREANLINTYKNANGEWKKGTPDFIKRLSGVGTAAKPNATRMKVAQEAISDPDRITQLHKATQDPQFAEKLFMNDLVESSIDATTGTFDPARARAYLHANQHTAAKAVPKSTMWEFDEFMKRAEVVNNNPTGQRTALRMYAGTGGLSIGLAGTTWYLSGNNPTASLAAGSTVLLGKQGMKMFAEKVLMNPKNARIATGLLGVDPLTKTAKQGTRDLLMQMKGLQVLIASPHGDNRPAEITNEGKIKFLDEKN